MSDTVTSTPVSLNGESTPEIKTVEIQEVQVSSRGDELAANLSSPPEQPKGPETPEVSPPEQPKEDQRLTSRFQELKRREREAYKREEAIKAQDARIKAVDEMKASPNLLERLKAVDLTFEDLVEFVIAGEQPAKPLTVEDKVNQLELKLKDKEEQELKAVEAAKAKEWDDQVQSYKDTVSQLAQANPEYELIHTTGNEDLVYDLVMAVYSANNLVLPIHEAMQMVEAKLQQEAEEKILKANKFKSRFQPQQENHQASPPPAKPQVPVTLSSSQSTQTTVKPASHQLTREEAREKAAAMLRFKQ